MAPLCRRKLLCLAIASLCALVACSACGGGSRATTRSTGVRTITIVVENGAPVGGIQRPTVEQGERIALVVRSDVADDVHLHGYDLKAAVKPGSSARIVFVAELAGRFVVELESRHVQIAQLEVRP